MDVTAAVDVREDGPCQFRHSHRDDGSTLDLVGDGGSLVRIEPGGELRRWVLDVPLRVLALNR
jgi:hypothetical protein